VLKCMSDLLEKEDFPLAMESSEKIISDFIQTFRFEYSDKDINTKTNFIIGKLNEYRVMNTKTKNELVKKFYEKETNDRDLPNIYRNQKEPIDTLIQNDIYTYRDIFCVEENPSKPMELTVTDILDYVSLTNMLISRYPDFFKNDSFKANTIHNLSQLATITALPSNILSNIKKTLKKLDKQDNKIKRLFF